MKRIMPIILISIITMLSCSEDNDDKVSQANITFNFSHNWDASAVTNNDFNTIQYTNANGEELSITKLRYLISNIIFKKSNGEIYVINGYNLVDVTNNANLSFTPITTIPTGAYSSVSFTFGFNNDANYNNIYTDLNSASWSVPTMLGGGYHFMQLEGKFINDKTIETGYAYHTIRAVDNSKTPQGFQDTFFEVDLGEVIISNNTIFNIEMNIAQWFKSPNIWNLNDLNNTLMPNFEAQKMMFKNGKNVFSLESINQ